MSEALLQLALFSAKTVIIFIFVVLIMLAFVVMVAKSRRAKTTGRLMIKNLNHQYEENQDMIMAEILPKKAYKQFAKDQKATAKKREANIENIKNIFVINFHGDIKASSVHGLSQSINAILNVAKPKDEVLVRLESPGGMVPGYGLGAAQLMRLRDHNIPLTIAVDKVAASGGYLMACTANKILAAPFAIIGSIGVVIQMPNFNRALKNKQIDFELHTAGEYKRTITMFGENTDEGRAKLHEELNEIHDQFKELIAQHRPQVDLSKAATGEYWLAEQAKKLLLVDELMTSDEYLFRQAAEANIYELCFEEKKPLLARLTESSKMMIRQILGFLA